MRGKPKPKRREKIGSINVLEFPKNASCRRFKFTWYDPVKRNTVAKSLDLSSWTEARKQAEQFNVRRWNRAIDDETGWTLRRALSAAISNSRSSYKKSLLKYAEEFIVWLRTHHRGVSLWRDVKPYQVQQYIAVLETDHGYAYCMARLNVISITSTFMYNNFGTRGVTGGVRITRERDTKPPVILCVEEIEHLIQAARVISQKNCDLKTPNVTQMYRDIPDIVLLRAYTGLRLREALNIRECDIDFESGTIRVEKTLYHTPKTKSSRREIPVIGRVLDMLKKRVDSLFVRGGDSFIFPDASNRAQEYRLGCKVFSVVRGEAYLSTHNDKFIDYQFRHLRASLITLLYKIGVREAHIQRYVGHSPSSLMKRVYMFLSIDDLRTEICDRLERYLADPSSFRRVDIVYGDAKRLVD